MWQGRGRAASGTQARALLAQGACRAAKRRLQCARFQPGGLAEGSLQPRSLRGRATGAKCALAGVKRSARPCPASLAQRPKPLPCRPLAEACPCAVEPPAPCPLMGWLIQHRLSLPLCRSRAKRGEAFLSLLGLLILGGSIDTS